MYLPQTKLCNADYFTPKNNMRYFSVSQFKSFEQCEAAALYELTSGEQREPTPSMLVGSYVDAYFSGEMSDFMAANPDIFKRDGTLKAEYVQADYIIERIKRDETMLRYLGGEQQVVMVGKIEGYPVKIKIDSYHKGIAIVDLKVMKDFAPVWTNSYGKQNFVSAWRYDLQMAVYQEVVYQNTKNRLPVFIAAATKEKEPDIAVIQIEQNRLNAQLELFKANMPRYAELKKGVGEPIRCEKCDYCKRTKSAQVITLSAFDEMVNQ